MSAVKHHCPHMARWFKHDKNPPAYASCHECIQEETRRKKAREDQAEFEKRRAFWQSSERWHRSR